MHARGWWWRGVMAGALCLAGIVPRAGGVVQELVGVAVFEVEAAEGNLSPRSGYSWVMTNAVAGHSGSGYAEAQPNTGGNLTAGWLTNSPELQLSVQLTQELPHYVWVRAYATNNNDDSVHVGMDGDTNGASGITLAANQLGSWYWTTNRLSGPRPTVGGGAGIHTVQVWMREDGARLDRLLLTTNANLLPQIGNVWHIPNNPEAVVGLAGMRLPLRGMAADTAVRLYTGNQYQGGGNAADQAQTGSAIFYRRAGEPAWSTLPLYFHAAGGNNKYYSNSIPAGAFAPGDTVEYYLRAWYTDRLPTYVHGNDALSQASELESLAQADPFSYDIAWPLEPDGDGYISISNMTDTGLVEARLYTNSGHLAVAGPDLNGAPLASVVGFAPPQAKSGGEWHHVGRVLGANLVSNHLDLVQQFAGTSVMTRLSFRADGVMRYEVVDWGGLAVSETEITAPSDADEHFYGFGEKFNSFDQAGRRVQILTRDQFFPKGDNAYKVAPWFVSTRGYGFHLDSTAESWFDMRAQQADRYVVSCLFPTLAFNVVFGPRLPDVLRRYTEYTGRPPRVPPWVFAPWMSSDIWRNGGEVRYVISRYREYGIPGSAFVFDSPWEVGYNDFTWNMTQFGNGGTYEGIHWPGFASLGDMMSFLRTNGFKAVCWMTPFLNTSSVNDGVGGQNFGVAANYAEAAASNYLVRASPGGPPLSVNWWKGTGSPVDFTNPDAALWMQRQLSNLVVQSGGVIGGFKTDDGESGSSDGNVYIPTNAVYFDGRTGLEMRNGYCVDYHRTIWSVLGTNGTLFARSGFTGTQAYPVGWAGDNQPNFGVEGIQGVAVAGQGAAMSGMALWSHDICGYDDAAERWSSTPENLFMRWTQFGALTPVMQMHRQVGSGRQYPWSFGSAGLSNYVYWAKLHTALFPYLYTCAGEASATGLPIIRPLVLLDQTDVNTHGLQHTYLLGNDLLVAVIVTNNAVARTVYLPPGRWCDYFTRQVYEGGQHIAWANADQSQTPLFVRAGGIIPMVPTSVATLCDAAYVGNPGVPSWDGELEFFIYPGTNSSYTVYDGTTLQVQSNGTVLALALDAAPRPVLLRVVTEEPFSVEQDGVSLARYTNALEFAQAGTGWRYVAPDCEIKLAHGGGATHLTLAPDSVGDGISDSWRATHFGTGAETNAQSCASCDADGDGADNWAEYISGTLPTNGLSVLRITELAGQTRELSWASTPGRRYQVLGATNLATPPEVLSGFITAVGTNTSFIDTNATLRHFYRVQVDGP